VMIEVGGKTYVRSIQKVNPDSSLTFYCAIETGLVLSLCEKEDFIATLEKQIHEISENIGSPDCCLLFECILRRLEVLKMNDDKRNFVMNLFKNAKSIGFHTYGEQEGGLHINQTLTGVAFGKK